MAIYPTKFECLLTDKTSKITIWQFILAIVADVKDALNELPLWEKYIHIFWLFGPFILLIERSPADAWLSIISIAFIVKLVLSRDKSVFSEFWVKTSFVFWIWCLFSALISGHPAYSFGEALVWFRFPLFAMATVFWLAAKPRLLYGMLFSILMGTLVMCLILSAELLIEGQKNGRLMWPYGDLVSGNYLAKFGLPAFVLMVTFAVSLRGNVAWASGLFAIFSMCISILTGERINLLIRACAGMLAGLVWKPLWSKYIILVILEIMAIVATFLMMPSVAKRYTSEFFAGASNLSTSSWLQTLNGGLEVAKSNLVFGIGPGNFRIESFEILENIRYARPDNHPHNYYIQMLCETGVIGLLLGTLFITAIVLKCFRSSLKNRQNAFAAIAWVIPFGLFWPVATTADFFGQWNNIFMWSSIAIALASSNLKTTPSIN